MKPRKAKSTPVAYPAPRPEDRRHAQEAYRVYLRRREEALRQDLRDRIPASAQGAKPADLNRLVEERRSVQKERAVALMEAYMHSEAARNALPGPFRGDRVLEIGPPWRHGLLPTRFQQFDPSRFLLDRLVDVELEPFSIFCEDWSGGSLHYGVGKTVKEKPDNEHYSISGSEVDVTISNASRFEIPGGMACRSARFWAMVRVNGLLAPEGYGYIQILPQVQVAQYRTDKPMEEISPYWDAPYLLRNAPCAGSGQSFGPQQGVISIEPVEQTLDTTLEDVAPGDKFFVTQYLTIKTCGCEVALVHNGIGQAQMPYPHGYVYGLA